MKIKKKIKAYMVSYRSSYGIGGLEWRIVHDQITVNYPRIFMSKEEAKNYIVETKNKNLRIIPCEIFFSI